MLSTVHHYLSLLNFSLRQILIFWTLRSHLYRKHGKKDPQGTDIDPQGMDMDTCLGDTVIEDEPEQEDTIQYTTAERQRKAALFILKAREERMLTQNALNGLLEDITCKYGCPF